MNGLHFSIQPCLIEGAAVPGSALSVKEVLHGIFYNYIIYIV